MPSPFPGMNPYIEQDAFWHDFQLEFLPAIRGRLVAQVRPTYIVMLDEHRYVQELPPEPRRLWPFRRLAGGGQKPNGRRGRRRRDSGAPTQVHIPVQDVRRGPFLEVRDRLGRD